jgi:hypothetical protein
MQYEITRGLIMKHPVFSKMGGPEVRYRKMYALLDYIVGQKLGKYCGFPIVSKAYLKKSTGEGRGICYEISATLIKTFNLIFFHHQV